MLVLNPRKAETPRKVALFLAVVGGGVLLLGCGKPAGEAVSAPVPTRSASETVSEADQLYAQRADVMKV